MDKRILLIDDVLTTGSTLIACTRILRKGGARSIDVLALARVIQDLGDTISAESLYNVGSVQASSDAS
ncbi:MAG: ComF family protein [Geminicoccales bacterium]